MNTNDKKVNINDPEIRFLAVLEQEKIISEAQKKLASLGSIGFNIYYHPTINIEEYEKYMKDYLSEEQKVAYQKWKKENPDMFNFFTRED
jgi:hypothetical protein